MILIRNVSLASGKTFKKVNLLFDENIRQIGPGVSPTGVIDAEYDYEGCIIIPGAVDMHTHLFGGDDSDSKVIREATLAALEGGITTLADLSYHTAKPILRPPDLEYYLDRITRNSHCDIALWGHADFSKTPYHLDYINELWSAGVCGFLLMAPSPNKVLESVSYGEIMDLFDEIYDSDISFAFQGFDATEETDVTEPVQVLCAQRLAAIRKILRRLQDNPLHLPGIYDKDSLDVLNIAFRRNDLTYAVPIEVLVSLIYKMTNVNTASESGTEHFRLLLDSMKNGKLYAVSSEAGKKIKSKDNISDLAFSGFDNNWLKWMVPWVFSELWQANRVPIQSCIRMVSENPAKRLGLFPAKGCIRAGSDADITIIDPTGKTRTGIKDPEGNAVELSCSVKAVFLRGKLQYPSVDSKPGGCFVPRTGQTRRKSSSTCWN